jgi:hypothetical protein
MSVETPRTCHMQNIFRIGFDFDVGFKTFFVLFKWNFVFRGNYLDFEIIDNYHGNNKTAMNLASFISLNTFQIRNEDRTMC